MRAFWMGNLCLVTGGMVGICALGLHLCSAPNLSAPSILLVSVMLWWAVRCFAPMLRDAADVYVTESEGQR